ncbi:MAG: hypothetical protein AAGF01_17285 [Cyanobacteria bacterium P01_G01_bin.38]
MDVTSKTQIDAYAALRVAELWCYEHNQLSIYRLRSDGYQKVQTSPTFPDSPVIELV